MSFVWDTTGIVNIILDVVVFLLVYSFLFYTVFKVVKRKIASMILLISFVLFLICYLFNLSFGLIITAFLSATFLSIVAFANLGDIRSFIANPFKKSSSKVIKGRVDKIIDRHALYLLIEQTVKILSTNKIGGLMIFEKETSLEDLYKSGVMVKAPVSSELLWTIFYNGTRLHDGAVIIHGDEIVCAAVVLPLSTKAFSEKYGTRHRAAIGVSEICDAVAVVVSEETGRISIAVNGEIETVTLDSFLRVFENYMMELK